MYRSKSSHGRRWLIVLIISTLAFTSAFAEHVIPDSITVKLTFTPNIENGKRVYEVCASCHLPDGWGNRDGVYPQLAGQHATVLMKQLLDIREGRRDNPVMFPFVQQRSIGGYQELADVVAYISTLPMTPFQGQGKWGSASPEYKQGKQLFEQNCAACHGQQAEGNSDARYPRLQGQHYAYLLLQARKISKGLRKANPGMMEVLQRIDEQKIQLILNYVSRIEVPRDDLQKIEVEQ